MAHRLSLLAVFARSVSLAVSVAPERAPVARRAVTVRPEATFEPTFFEDRSSAPDAVEVTLIAAPARLELQPGTLTDVYAYNGRVPGPTLEVREGDRVIVHFRNDLPDSTTIHWHGLHVPFVADGSPFHPVGPGETYDYDFTIRPGAAGTYWYHPHPHHHTGRQVARGLYGAIIVRAADDPLPGSLTERVLILSDNRFLPDGSIDLADPHSPQGRVDAENGREGDVLFVNGTVSPTLTIRAGEVQRWRVINASAARVYRLALGGHTFLHVGSDGGLFERPRAVEEIHLHGFQFQVLDRNGVPEPYRSWKDTVNVPKHETARFIVRYDDYPGKWMFHCHILDHEDHGMMGILEVR